MGKFSFRQRESRSADRADSPVAAIEYAKKVPYVPENA
jgi:hypothetical protein